MRGIDRLELLIIALGILAVLTAAAGAGALGTAVHDARSRVYIEQAQTRHTVIAKVSDGSTIASRVDGNTATKVNVRWQVNGAERNGSFRVDGAVKAGDPLKIWVDRNGDPVGAPAPPSRAGVEAVGAAYAAWQAVALAAAGLVRWGRSHLDGRRDSAWEHGLRSLIHDDGRRRP